MKYDDLRQHVIATINEVDGYGEFKNTVQLDIAFYNGNLYVISYCGYFTLEKGFVSLDSAKESLKQLIKRHPSIYSDLVFKGD